jgi:hypothetical protein
MILIDGFPTRDCCSAGRAIMRRSNSFSHVNTPELIEWPAPLDKDAFHGPAGEFVRLVEPYSESSDASLLHTFLTLAGSLMGRGPRFQIGGSYHGTNLFTCEVGTSADSRKGTGTETNRRFFQCVAQHDPRFAVRLEGGTQSGEGIGHSIGSLAVHRRDSG